MEPHFVSDVSLHSVKRKRWIARLLEFYDHRSVPKLCHVGQQSGRLAKSHHSVIYIFTLSACASQSLGLSASSSPSVDEQQIEHSAQAMAANAIQNRKTLVRSLLEFRRKNVVMQEWDLSCSAAALTTLLRYQHGLNLTEKEVASALIQRQEYIENPDLLNIKQGFSLLDLKRYVDNMGFPGNGYGRLDLNHLIKLAPLLVPVRLEGYNHFVVFRGVAGKRVLLADPVWGHHVISREKFLNAWMNLPELGRVGFSVEAEVPKSELNVLGPTELDFVMLQ